MIQLAPCGGAPGRRLFMRKTVGGARPCESQAIGDAALAADLIAAPSSLLGRQHKRLTYLRSVGLPNVEG